MMAQHVTKFNGRPKAVFMVGLPGSGKTTWRNAFLKNRRESWVVASSDDIALEIAARNSITYEEALDVYGEAIIRHIWYIIKLAQSEGKNIIVDQCNGSAEKRGVLLEIFRKTHDVTFVALEVPASNHHDLFTRTVNRTVHVEVGDEVYDVVQDVPEPVFTGISKHFSYPSMFFEAHITVHKVPSDWISDRNRWAR